MARAAKKKAEAADLVPGEDSGVDQPAETAPQPPAKAPVKASGKSADKAAKAPTAKRTFVIAVTNLKGGVAKTTTACNVGWGLTDSGLSCLIVDLDMQANATSDLGFDISQIQGNGRSMASVLRGQYEMDDILLQYSETDLWVAPSAKALTDVERQLSTVVEEQPAAAGVGVEGRDRALHELHATGSRRPGRSSP